MLAACKGDLLTGQGNDFPCDFSQPEGARDAVCAPHEVCGVDNHCRAWRYEGPQFDVGASLPHFGGATLLHPLTVLDGPVLAATHRVGPGTSRGVALVDHGGALALALVETEPELQVGSAPLPQQLPPMALSAVSAAGEDWSVAVGSSLGQDAAFVVSLLPNGTLAVVPVRDGLQPGARLIEGADRLRTGDDRALLLRFEDGGQAEPRAGEVRQNGVYSELSLHEPLADAGTAAVTVLDGRYLSGDELLVLGREGFFLRRAGGQVVRLSANATALGALDAGTVDAPLRVSLRHDVSGSVVAYTKDRGGLAFALSAWRLDRGPTPGITRLWNDCSPCRFGRILAFAPTLDPTPAVEVLCAAPLDLMRPDAGTALALTRVVGSAAADERQECVVEPLEAPFELGQISFSSLGRRAREGALAQPVFDDASGAGVLLGGKRGQLWSGPSFSRALPLFLERTPLSTGMVQLPGGGEAPVALTDRYVAVLRPGLGYQAVDLPRATGAALAADVVPSAFVGSSHGWGVLSTADTFFLRPPGSGSGPALTFGPRLVDARGAAARAPFFAEAVTDVWQAGDGGLLSFVITADDSVYFAPAPSSTTATPGVLEPLEPQVTPSPSSPIRSLALERSVVGTNGVDKVRAYVVAGRQLFVVTLDGTPARWSATPLVLQGGEPLEVWMDHPLGGLGRVGYRDGEVFTLPGGFLLVGELPRADAGMPAQVLDYENLGGWPVALTNVGLFEAHYPVVNGELQNRFPDGGAGKAMQWARLSLQGGAEPWLGRKARLQVTHESRPWTPDSGVGGYPPPPTVRVFHLLVYLDDQVLDVGTLTRR